MSPKLAHWTSVRRLFLVSPLESGLWLARESEGRAEGLFRCREDAIRYATLEGGRHNAVMLVPEVNRPLRHVRH